jgi:cobalamin biosynthesis Mg chelatase CobN
VFHAARRIALFGAALAAVLFAAAPAFAHDAQGVMTAEARPGADPTSVTARARVVYANDGHPAGEAAVTVTAIGPGGGQAGPTTLKPVDDGEYEAVLALSAAGDWSLQFTSTSPAATATTTHTVNAVTTTSGPPTSEPRRAIQSSDEDSSGMSPVVIAVIAVVAVLAALAGGGYLVRRRR